MATYPQFFPFIDSLPSTPSIQPDWHLADPICTFVFSVLVLFSTLTVLRDALRVLMEGT